MLCPCPLPCHCPPPCHCLLPVMHSYRLCIQVQPRYLSCITTTCFYHAAKAIQGSENAPSLETLISVSQSDGGCGDIHRMETIICDKLRPAPDEQSVTALSLLRAVIDAFAELTHVDLSGHMTKLSSKLIMCLCHAELLAAPVSVSTSHTTVSTRLVSTRLVSTRLMFQMVMIALAVFGAHLQQLGMDNVQAVAFTTILNICQVCSHPPSQSHSSLTVPLSYNLTVRHSPTPPSQSPSITVSSSMSSYLQCSSCHMSHFHLQICDRDFLPYQEHISHFLAENYAAPSSLPKLPLKWKISNRTMWVLRPHYRWDYDLPSIPEAPIDSLDMRTGSVESLNDMEVDEGIPGTPNPDDFSNHFSYPNSPSEPSPISASLPPCHILTYADVVSGRFYHE